jgi:hypothetical protein
MRYKTKGREGENEFKWNTKHQEEKSNLFTTKLVLKLKEETSIVLHLNRRFVWC